MKYLLMILLLLNTSCEETTTDEKQASQQAQVLEQAHMQIGMPSTPGFQEKRMVKDLYELRDKAIATHAYIMNDMQGCLVYLGPSVGYGLPYAVQFTSPTRPQRWGESHIQVPQTEPNGLFMPNNAEGTWIMLKDPDGPDTKPVYVEPRVVVSPFRLTTQECTPKQSHDVSVVIPSAPKK
jgi:hypothetical protein